eukprot:m.439402 g.439402  ORF g.439402 m.439402 type:complete len:174 (-) comp21450_c0_seq5:46-567(-)
MAATSTHWTEKFLPRWSRLAGIWTVPNFMAIVNVPVVHASAQALGYGGGQLYLRDNLAPRGIKRESRLFPTCYGLVTSAIAQSILIASLVYLVTAVVLGKLPVVGAAIEGRMTRSLVQTPVDHASGGSIKGHTNLTALAKSRYVATRNVGSCRACPRGVHAGKALRAGDSCKP